MERTGGPLCERNLSEPHGNLFSEKGGASTKRIISTDWYGVEEANVSYTATT